MSVKEIHFVGGVAQSEWISGKDLIIPDATIKTLEESEIDILEYMNADHTDVIDLYANFLCKKRGSGWKMVGIDCDGFDLKRKGGITRLSFDSRIFEPNLIRKKLVYLTGVARKLMIG